MLDQVPRRHFKAILAAPHWQQRQTGLEAICALPVQACALEPAYVFLWASNALLPDALRVLTRWGARYAGILTWCKTSQTGQPRLGLGSHLRSATEHVLIGCWGAPVPRSRTIPSYFLAPRPKTRYRRPESHHRKPDEVYAIVESLSLGPYLELYARHPIREGWTSWGDQGR